MTRKTYIIPLTECVVAAPCTMLAASIENIIIGNRPGDTSNTVDTEDDLWSNRRQHADADAGSYWTWD